MLSRSVHNAITVVLSLSIAWHSIAGCCAHHSHSNADCGDAACGEVSVVGDQHSCCDHRSELPPIELALSEVQADNATGTFKQDSTTSRCLGGKCAFVTGEKSPVIALFQSASIDLDWSIPDRAGEASLVTLKCRALLRPPSLIGATSARPQQLFCVWLI